MESPSTVHRARESRDARAGDRADFVRVLTALALLALLSWFDQAGAPRPALDVHGAEVMSP
jgi:hypothetical protein